MPIIQYTLVALTISMIFFLYFAYFDRDQQIN